MKASVRRLLPGMLVLLGFWCHASAQLPQEDEGSRKIEFPDIPGFLTLKCDLHMHTVFSDGSVWPSIRVQEALMDGLDAICITDHLEYQPHRADVPNTDRNRSTRLAEEAARGSDLLIIPGAEITRSMPPGHFNTLFIKDANALIQQEVTEVFREAKRQQAFVFWNHPHWTAQRPDGVATLTEMHQKMLEEDLFTGIEIYNEVTYSDEALVIADTYGLTIVGNSDVHGPIDWVYNVAEGEHRPVTLVFAKDRNLESIQEALTAQRTAVWFGNTLVGDAKFLIPLVENSLEVSRKPGQVDRVLVTNHSDANYIVENQSDFTLHNMAAIFLLKAHETTPIEVKTLERLSSYELRFKVLNAFTSPDQHPLITLEIH
jgi:hypothetical protein